MTDTTDQELREGASMTDPIESAARALRAASESHVPSDNDSADSYWRTQAKAALSAYRDAEIENLRAQVNALQKFKEYVHQRLDSAGIPTHPEGPHSAAGCRIGDRLDLVFNPIEDLDEPWVEVRAHELNTLKAQLADCRAVLREKGHREDCQSNTCKHCGVALHMHTVPINHPLDGLPCSDTCGYARVMGEG